MCYNCGCFNTYDDMGNPDNITEGTFDNLGKHKKKDLKSTKLLVLKMLEEKKLDPQTEKLFAKAAKAWGQPVEEAKQNTQKLLKDRLE